MKYNLNQKRFILVENHNGLSDRSTVFHYFQVGEFIAGEYRGGEIAEGRIVGKFSDSDRIEILFHCVTKTAQLLSGKSSGLVSSGEDGRLTLAFDWQWLYGASGGGSSYYVEC